VGKPHTRAKCLAHFEMGLVAPNAKCEPSAGFCMNERLWCANARPKSERNGSGGGWFKTGDIVDGIWPASRQRKPVTGASALKKLQLAVATLIGGFGVMTEETPGFPQIRPQSLDPFWDFPPDDENTMVET